MKLSTATMNELRAELDRLEAREKELSEELGRIDEDADAIRILLGVKQTTTKVIRTITKLTDHEDDNAPKTPSFAAQVRQVLGEFNRPASPSQVMNKLKARGIGTENGKLIRKVSSELSRASQSRSVGVVRVGRGKYKIKEKK